MALLLINIVGIFAFIGVAYLFSNDRKNIQWKSVGIVLAIELFFAWFFMSFSIGRDAVKAAADGFAWLVNIAYQGIVFAIDSKLGTSNQCGWRYGANDELHYFSTATNSVSRALV